MKAHVPTRLRSLYLMIAVVLVSVLAEVSFGLVEAGYQPFERGVIIARVLMVANIVIGLMGLWTARWLGWLAYVMVSIALAVLIGAVTPLSVVGIVARLMS